MTETIRVAPERGDRPAPTAGALGLRLLPPLQPNAAMRDLDPGGPAAGLVAIAAADITGGRYESALDATLAAVSEEPSSAGLTLLHAELLLATGRPSAAGALLRTAVQLLPLVGATDLAPALDHLQVLARPTASGLLRLAREAVADRNIADAARYVPVALATASSPIGSGERLELVEAWAALASEPAAVAALVAELAAAGDAERARAALQRLPSVVDPVLAAGILPIAAALGDAAEWRLAPLVWRAAERPGATASAVVAAFDAVGDPARHPSARIQRGLLALASGANEKAREVLTTTRPLDVLHAYAALLGAALAAANTGDDGIAAAALGRAAQIVARPDLALGLTHAQLVPGNKGLADLGAETADRLAAAGNPDGGADLLEQLVAALPGNALLARRYAALLGSSGQTERGLARLTLLLERQERTGEKEAALQTMRAILQLTPGDVPLRERLIQEEMRRGRLTAAMDERCIGARALAAIGRQAEAIEQLRQGFQVGAMAGDWAALERIFALVVQIAPSDIDFRHRAVTTAIEHGKLEEAVRHLWDIVRIATGGGEVDETIAALHQIIALAPSDTDAYHKLGESLAAIGEFQQAERVYRRLRLLLPDDPVVRAKQAALEALARQAS